MELKESLLWDVSNEKNIGLKREVHYGMSSKADLTVLILVKAPNMIMYHYRSLDKVLLWS